MLPLQERIRAVVGVCESQQFCNVIIEEARMRFRIRIEAKSGGRFWKLTDPETFFFPNRSVRFPGIFLTPGFDNSNPYNAPGVGYALPSAAGVLLGKGPHSSVFSPTVDYIDELQAPFAFQPLFNLAAFDAARAALAGIDRQRKGAEIDAAIAGLEALSSRIFGRPHPPPPSLPRGSESIAVFTMRARPKGKPPGILSAVAPKGEWFLEHVAAEANASQSSPLIRFASGSVGLSMAYHKRGWEVDDAYRLADGESLLNTVWVQADRGEEREKFSDRGFGIAVNDRVDGKVLRSHFVTLRNHVPAIASRAVKAHELVDCLAGLVPRLETASQLVSDRQQYFEHSMLRKSLDDVIQALMRGMAHRQAGPKATVPSSMPSLHLVVPRAADP